MASNKENPTNEDEQSTLEELSSMVKSGSILDRDGFIQHASDKELAEKIMQRFSDCGLMKFLTHDYLTVHKIDSTEWFMNARIVGEEIHSKVQDMETVTAMGDIRAAFDFAIPKGAHPDLSQYTYNQQKFWEEIKSEKAPANLKLSFKKKILIPEYERAMDILIRILLNKVAGTDDVTAYMLATLSAIMTNYSLDWPQIIFNHLRAYVEKAVDSDSKSLSQKVGYGFLVQYLLSLKGIKRRPGVPVHRNAYLCRTKPPTPKGQAATPPKAKGKKKKVVAHESSSNVPIATVLKKIESLKSKKSFKDVEVESRPAKKAKAAKNEGENADMDDEIVARIELGGDSDSVDEGLLEEYMRVKNWIQWRMGDIDTLQAGLNHMRAEEEFSLRWLNISKLSDGTLLSLTEEAYSRKMSENEAAKGKSKATEEEVQSRNPQEAEKAQLKELRRTLQHSIFEQEMGGPGSTSGAGQRSEPREVTPEGDLPESETQVPLEGAPLKSEEQITPESASPSSQSPEGQSVAQIRQSTGERLPTQLEGVDFADDSPATSPDPMARVEAENEKKGAYTVEDEEAHASSGNREAPDMETNSDSEFLQVPRPSPATRSDPLLAQIQKLIADQRVFLAKMTEAATETRSTKHLVLTQGRRLDDMSSRQTDVVETLRWAEDMLNNTWGLVGEMANRAAFLQEQNDVIQQKLNKVDQKVEDIYGKVDSLPQQMDVLTEGLILLHEKFNDAKKGEDRAREGLQFVDFADIPPLPNEAYSLQNLPPKCKNWDQNKKLQYIKMKNEERKKRKRQEAEKE
ncbi:PREDICTED: uncharacterized protein LOC109167327 [Ipomoea nil]|uniref:uncharacterized protein LOC109167327 n=1 Tax=Ipomoea nil TaxID=35883 RepID=UPI000901FB8C|nr:PREDICTED: uncharacterized protein LOC109167327 [Ipomoea nil]